VRTPDKDFTPFEWSLVTAFLITFTMFVFACGGC